MAWLVFGRNEPWPAVFDDMLARWPDDAYALASRAHLHARHRLDAALADSERLVGAEPDNARALVQPRLHAGDRRTLGRGAGGLPPRHRALPKLDRAWYGLGLVLIRLQRYDEAVAGAQAQHRTAAHEPLRLVPAGAGACRPPGARRGGEDHRHLKGFEPKVAAQLERETGLARVAVLRRRGRPRGAACSPAGDGPGFINEKPARSGHETERGDNCMQVSENHQRYWRRTSGSPRSCWRSGSW
jgi:hypothetical protein